MKSHRLIRCIVLISSVLCLLAVGAVFAATSGTLGTTSNLATVATNVTSNFSAIAKLITGGAYIAGFAFAVGAVVKFKAHKDNPTQVMISQPIALLFVGAALIFIPSVFKITGSSLFGASGTYAGPSGTTNI